MLYLIGTEAMRVTEKQGSISIGGSVMKSPVTFSCVVFSVVLLLAAGIAGANTQSDNIDNIGARLEEVGKLT